MNLSISLLISKNPPYFSLNLLVSSDQINNLIRQGYSRGLVRALSENAYNYDFRFWIIDNSGSMQIGDGHRIVPTGKGDNSLKTVASTRWEELKETVQYHAKIAALMDSPIIFKVCLSGASDPLYKSSL